MKYGEKMASYGGWFRRKHLLRRSLRTGTVTLFADLGGKCGSADGVLMCGSTARGGQMPSE
jgi:hypothetical protein